MIFLKIMLVFMPFRIKKIILNKVFGYKIGNDTYIGISWVFPDSLLMEDGAYVGHLNVVKNIDFFKMERNSRLGHQNTITCASKKNKKYYVGVDRVCEMLMGKHSTITRKHYFDCTDSISIGEFTTIAGFDSQFLTHSIDIYENKQSCKSIHIGSYGMIGTRCTVLPGSVLPDYSVLGAGALLNCRYSDSYSLYAGVPAKMVKKYSGSVEYFRRENGVVY